MYTTALAILDSVNGNCELLKLMFLTEYEVAKQKLLEEDKGRIKSRRKNGGKTWTEKYILRRQQLGFSGTNNSNVV